jgi:hypothetical protein
MKTVSIGTSKALVANGIVIESYFSWVAQAVEVECEDATCSGCYETTHSLHETATKILDADTDYPAPTVDELLPYIPYTVEVNETPHWFGVDQCQASYRDIRNYITKVDETYLFERVYGYNIVEAMAKLLLKLKELNLI